MGPAGQVLNRALAEAGIDREGAALRATVHLSYLLRLPHEDAKEAESAKFVADLKNAKHVAQSMAA